MASFEIKVSLSMLSLNCQFVYNFIFLIYINYDVAISFQDISGSEHPHNLPIDNKLFFTEWGGGMDPLLAYPSKTYHIDVVTYRNEIQQSKFEFFSGILLEYFLPWFLLSMHSHFTQRMICIYIVEIFIRLIS